MYYGDISLGDTVRVPFCTVGTTGAPTQLAGSPILSAYVDGGLTEITAGVSVSVDHDGRTGFNMATVVATSGNGFATATNVAIVITAGTVGGTSVVGYVVGAFSIENRPLTAAKIADNAITANKIASDAITDAKVASDVTIASVSGAVGSVTGNVGGNVTGSVGSLAAQAKLDVNAEVDSALDTAIPGSPTANSVNERIQTMDNSYTATRAGYIDNLNVGGNVASSAEVTAIATNTRVVRVVPPVIERPDGASDVYRIELLLYDEVGNMEAPDSAPTVVLTNQNGTDRSSRLDTTTMVLIETGRYRVIYTADPTDTLEQLVWIFSVVEGGATRKYGNQSTIVDTTAVDFTAADRTKLDTLHDTRIPGVIQPQTGDSFARLGAPAGASVSADIADLPTNAELATALAAADDAVLAAVAGVQSDTDNIQTRLPTLLVSGKMDSSVGAMAADTVTASALAADAANEIRDAVWDKVMAELSGVPGVTGSALEALEFLFALGRNKINQNATTQTLFKDDNSTTLAASTVSDDAVNFVRGKFA